MTVKPEMIFWTIAGNGICRHHVEPGVKLYVLKEEFPIPLRDIDVVRRTNTILDVLLESRIDDSWNVEGDRNLAEPWTGFTQFTALNAKPPDGRGAADKSSQQPQDPITHGQKYCQVCRMLLNEEKNTSGLF